MNDKEYWADQTSPIPIITNGSTRYGQLVLIRFPPPHVYGPTKLELLSSHGQSLNNKRKNSKSNTKPFMVNNA